MRDDPKNAELSLAEHSDEHMKHLGLSFTKLFLSVKIVACEQNLFFGCVRRETKAGNPSVFALHLCARKLTSFALCCYVIGLFNRTQTNHKHKRKGMQIGSKQPLVGEKRCVTSPKTAAEETRFQWKKEFTYLLYCLGVGL